MGGLSCIEGGEMTRGELVCEMDPLVARWNHLVPLHPLIFLPLLPIPHPPPHHVILSIVPAVR